MKNSQLFKPIITLHNFDVICLSETFLDSSYSSEDKELQLNGYKLVRSDHPGNQKRGGVCIYYKEALSISFLECKILSECLICEVFSNKSKIVVVSLYRSPSQSNDDFDQFLKGLEEIMAFVSDRNPTSIIILGDFNARSSSWWTDDITNFEGSQIDSLTTFYNLYQLISEPTHILQYSQSCIDLIFTNQPNLVIDSGVHPSLYPQCHHQITFCKINLKIEYPPPYTRLVWDYEKADKNAINRSIEQFDWNRSFYNLDVHEQVCLLNSTLLNIFSNFIPNKYITINDKDPPWMNDQIKTKISKKKQLYKVFTRNKNSFNIFCKLESISRELSDLILKAKDDYYTRLAKKLNNPSLRCKTYWSILKTFFNGKKVPLIPPLIINDQLVTDFKVKANHFNNHFSSQCSVINNDSQIPSSHIFTTFDKLNSIAFNEGDILKIVQNLNPNKAHGHDKISIRMLLLCSTSVIKPLSIIFRNCISTGIFPNTWKKANIIPIYKKGNKQLIKNYRPVSLLPICSKIFERLIYNSVFQFLDERKLLNPNQSGFRPGDSCTLQLISITHNIYSAFDSNPPLDARGVFLDISKAFDRVWHKGLLYKLHCNGICGNLLNLIESFLSDRYQKVVLNGQSSDWSNISAGVPQGSILGPLFFLIYINDLSSGINSIVKLFADDTSLFSIVCNNEISAAELNNDLKEVSKWAHKWKMSFNPDPSKQAQEVIFSRKTKKEVHPTLYFNNLPVQKTPIQKHLGLILDEKLSFNQHLKEKLVKANKGIGVLKKLQNLLPRSSLVTIYKSFIRPHLDYADVIYDQPNNANFCSKIEAVQYNAALAITGSIKGTSREKLYQELGWESLSKRRWFRRLCLFFKIQMNKHPHYLFELIPSLNHHYNTRNIFNLPNFFCRTSLFKNSFFPYSIAEWNKLHNNIRNSVSYLAFRKALLNYIRPSPNSVFNVFDPTGLKLLTRLRVGMSHLREHKFKHNFQDTLNPLCSCSLEVESTSHFFLRCQNYQNIRTALFNELQIIDNTILDMNEVNLTRLLLYGSDSFDKQTNAKVIMLSINFIKESGRFDTALF